MKKLSREEKQAIDFVKKMQSDELKQKIDLSELTEENIANPITIHYPIKEIDGMHRRRIAKELGIEL